MEDLNKEFDKLTEENEVIEEIFEQEYRLENDEKNILNEKRLENCEKLSEISIEGFIYSFNNMRDDIIEHIMTSANLYNSNEYLIIKDKINENNSIITENNHFLLSNVNNFEELSQELDEEIKNKPRRNVFMKDYIKDICGIDYFNDYMKHINNLVKITRILEDKIKI